MTTDGELTVVLKGSVEGPSGGPVRKEYPIEKMTDVRGGRFVLIDEDGEGRLMLTADELADLGGGGEP